MIQANSTWTEHHATTTNWTTLPLVYSTTDTYLVFVLVFVTLSRRTSQCEYVCCSSFSLPTTDTRDKCQLCCDAVMLHHCTGKEHEEIYLNSFNFVATCAPAVVSLHRCAQVKICLSAWMCACVSAWVLYYMRNWWNGEEKPDWRAHSLPVPLSLLLHLALPPPSVSPCPVQHRFIWLVCWHWPIVGDCYLDNKLSSNTPPAVRPK